MTSTVEGKRPSSSQEKGGRGWVELSSASEYVEKRERATPLHMISEESGEIELTLSAHLLVEGEKKKKGVRAMLVLIKQGEGRPFPAQFLGGKGEEKV